MPHSKSFGLGIHTLKLVGWWLKIDSGVQIYLNLKSLLRGFESTWEQGIAPKKLGSRKQLLIGSVLCKLLASSDLFTRGGECIFF